MKFAKSAQLQLNELRLCKLYLLFSGAHAQCPPSYTYIGGRCLWFMEEESLSYLASSEICEFFGGTLAKLDDCHLWDEVTSYILDNSE